MTSSLDTHVVAMGGGGFSMEPDNPALDRYVLNLARRPNPAVCFLATASGDADSYISSFYAAFGKFACRPTHLPLFARTPDLKTMILEQDVIYVGGGNTKSMLAVWREWGIPALLHRAWESGSVLAGVSAGAICWFETGVTDSSGTGLYPLLGLGFLPGVHVARTTMASPNDGWRCGGWSPTERSPTRSRSTTALPRTSSTARWPTSSVPALRLAHIGCNARMARQWRQS